LGALQVLNRLAFQVEGRAKMLAPVDTGALRNSGFTDPATYGNLTAIVGFTMSYAPHLELGTYKMGARPYLMPAVETIAYLFNSGETWRELCR
jgi:hypothetical protein